MGARELVSYRTAASYYRAGLRARIVAPEEIIAWADRIIEAEPTALAEISDIAVTDPRNIRGLIEALGVVAGEETPEAVVLTLLETIQKQWNTRQISLNEAIERVTLLRIGGELRGEVAVAEGILEDQYELYTNGAWGTAATMEADVQRFFEDCAKRSRAHSGVRSNDR